MDQLSIKCIQVLDYVKHLKSERKSVPTTIDKENLLLSGSHVPSCVSVHLSAPEDGTLVSIDRAPTSNPPSIPSSLVGVVSKANDPSKEPALVSKNINPNDMNMLQQELEHYLIFWKDWSAQELKNKEHNDLYKKWFGIAQRLKEDGDAENREVVCGIGVALWSRDGERLEYPFIIQPCEISVQNKPPYTVNITAALAPAKLNLSACVQFGFSPEEASQIEKKYNDPGVLDDVHPFDPESYMPILSELAGRIDAKGQVVGSENYQSGPNLSIVDSWLVFERERPSDRILEDVKNLKSAIEGGQKIPSYVYKILGHTLPQEQSSPVFFYGIDQPPSSEDESHQSPAPAFKQLCFPLPYNEDQVDVVRKLEKSDGVVVQGPPGTGKSHTIANVISHYLSEGKRVLVTSSSAHALDVVQGKIPEHIRGLSVPMLSSDVSAVKDIEKSLGSINEKINQSRSEHVRREQEKNVKIIKDNLADVSDRIFKNQKNLEEVFRHQNQHWLIKDESGDTVFEGSTLNLCQHVEEFRRDHEWMKEIVNFKEKQSGHFIHELSIPDLSWSSSDHDILMGLKKHIAHDLHRSHERFPYSASRTERPSRKFVDRAWEVAQLQGKFQTYKSNNKNPLNFIGLSPSFQEEALDDVLKNWKQWDLYDDLLSSPTVLSDSVPLTGYSVVQLLSATNPDVVGEFKKFVSFARQVTTNFKQVSKRVACPSFLTSNQDFINWLAKKSQSSGLAGAINNLLIPSALKKDLDSVLVNGSVAKTSEQWQEVSKYVERQRAVEKMKRHWQHYSNQMGVGNQGTLSPDDVLERAEHVLVLLESYHGLESLSIKVHQAIVAIFQHHYVDCVWSEEQWKSSGMSKDVKQQKNEVFSVLQEAKEMLSVQGQVDEVTKNLEDNYLNLYRSLMDHSSAISSNICHKVVKFFEKDLQELSKEQALMLWEETEHDIERMISLQTDFEKWNEMLAKLSISCPHLALLYGEGQDITSYQEIQSAWRWLHLEACSKTVDQHEAVCDLYRHRRALKSDKSQSELDLINHLAWMSVTENVDEEQSQALTAYISSIGKIGKTGKGKRAARYRKSAQEAMKKCYDLVPCWIMPIERVSEDMPAILGLFDLVIIDEASQSNISAFPALLRGKKILVVGDDKQVSPSVAGLDERKMSAQANQMLSGIKFANQMLPDHSIYDLCNIVFSQHRVMLKEHFRCVSPIITFSNQMYYEGKIIPLRTPPSSELLFPTLIDVYVSGGKINQRNENEAEADAVVNEILQIISSDDPKLKEKTIGVVTLVSNTKQALLITKKIAQSIPEAERLSRHISVGNAPMFQGKERDIMLISGYFDRCGGFFDTNENHQRMNVAASRARDRMYLFRSIPDKLVNPSTLYGKLIRNFQDPQLGANEVNDLSPAQNEFEKMLSEVLQKEGYNIQLHSGPGLYDVDITVLGDNGKKMAIQCDGGDDEKDFVSDFVQSLRQQEVLERAGWSFWRCFVSHFMLHRDQAIREMLAELSKVGVFPRNGSAYLKDVISESRVVSFDGKIEKKAHSFPVGDLKKLTFFDDPSSVMLREKCENDFEKYIFDAVTSMGYRIHPQYVFENYRLDMIVWDHQGNCVVLECDGDTFHGLDESASDNERERFLSANGFRFVRCYYSEMIASPDSLWEKIDKQLSIFGVGKWISHLEIAKEEDIFG